MKFIINFESRTNLVANKGERFLSKLILKKPMLDIIIAPNLIDISNFKGKFEYPIIAQHADKIATFRASGYVSPKALARVGAIGVIVNSPYHRLGYNGIYDIIKENKKYGLLTFLYVYNQDEYIHSLVFDSEYIIIKTTNLNELSSFSLDKQNIFIDYKIDNKQDIISLRDFKPSGIVIEPDDNVFNLDPMDYA